MTAWAHCRGWVVYWDTQAEIWRYEDGSPAANWGGDERPCVECGLTAEPNGPDPCLGMLPGVTSACCGHGNRAHAGIVFESGTIVSGFDVTHKKVADGGQT